MSDVDVFVIDDDFDPLADLSLDDGERDDAEADYLPPIPDADKSVVPPVVPLSAAERIENLLAGIPGQQFRLLHAVEFCTEPKTMDEAVADLDAAYPNTTSVYGSAQVVQLLERDGALERIVDEDAAHAAAGDAADALAEDEGFISVTPAPPCRYRATQAGLDAVAAHVNEGLVAEKIEEDERYLPIFQRVLEMCAGGREEAAPPRSWTRRWTATRCAKSRAASAGSSAASWKRRAPSNGATPGPSPIWGAACSRPACSPLPPRPNAREGATHVLRSGNHHRRRAARPHGNLPVPLAPVPRGGGPGAVRHAGVHALPDEHRQRAGGRGLPDDLRLSEPGRRHGAYRAGGGLRARVHRVGQRRLLGRVSVRVGVPRARSVS